MQDRANELIARLKDLAAAIPGDPVKYAVIAIAVLVILYIVRRILRRRRRAVSLLAADLTLNVELLGTAGPPAGDAVLEHYHVPMRLAAVVVAPAGRMTRLPPPDQLDTVFEAIVPGLADMVTAHEPLVRRWPAQLSSMGFAHSFFRNAKLPGDGGKGTHWCSAAGMIKVEGQPVMVGLIMRSQSPNSLGQTVIEQETKWLDIVRIRRAR